MRRPVGRDHCGARAGEGMHVAHGRVFGAAAPCTPRLLLPLPDLRHDPQPGHRHGPPTLDGQPALCAGRHPPDHEAGRLPRASLLCGCAARRGPGGRARGGGDKRRGPPNAAHRRLPAPARRCVARLFGVQEPRLGMGAGGLEGMLSRLHCQACGVVDAALSGSGLRPDTECLLQAPHSPRHQPSARRLQWHCLPGPAGPLAAPAGGGGPVLCGLQHSLAGHQFSRRAGHAAARRWVRSWGEASVLHLHLDGP